MNPDESAHAPVPGIEAPPRRAKMDGLLDAAVVKLLVLERTVTAPFRKLPTRRERAERKERGALPTADRTPKKPSASSKAKARIAELKASAKTAIVEPIARCLRKPKVQAEPPPAAAEVEAPEAEMKIATEIEIQSEAITAEPKEPATEADCGTGDDTQADNGAPIETRADEPVPAATPKIKATPVAALKKALCGLKPAKRGDHDAHVTVPAEPKLFFKGLFASSKVPEPEAAHLLSADTAASLAADEVVVFVETPASEAGGAESKAVKSKAKAGARVARAIRSMFVCFDAQPVC
ncbi:hypothetical protein Rsub_08028 [Raphidocelis subcapitata]|uniref:Uncharacterized protein n=1 Tax=Raphidocelis subcapitata TaxID=307507 RepID=A0A2V0P4S8_9CHLO|nr:hypothetical protein Rsub_08028 [Raphidocelis subcapitata]|eukprot:GBF94856.1 hypothetical protein Rsub_08028 [Raphidocelis subcapitata]